MTADQRGEQPGVTESPSDESPGDSTDGADATDGADDTAAPDRYEDHLGDVPDGSGCTEIWEHLSKQRSNGGPETNESDDDD